MLVFSPPRGKGCELTGILVEEGMWARAEPIMRKNSCCQVNPKHVASSGGLGVGVRVNLTSLLWPISSYSLDPEWRRLQAAVSDGSPWDSSGQARPDPQQAWRQGPFLSPDPGLWIFHSHLSPPQAPALTLSMASVAHLAFSAGKDTLSAAFLGWLVHGLSANTS